jgi:hypothetical protein
MLMSQLVCTMRRFGLAAQSHPLGCGGRQPSFSFWLSFFTGSSDKADHEGHEGVTKAEES